VNVRVPPSRFVTVGDTGSAVVDPDDVTEKPHIYVVAPGAAGSVAVAVAAATLPDELVTPLRCELVSGTISGVPTCANAITGRQNATQIRSKTNQRFIIVTFYLFGEHE
jgi:hypothetical protein